MTVLDLLGKWREVSASAVMQLGFSDLDRFKTLSESCINVDKLLLLLNINNNDKLDSSLHPFFIPARRINGALFQTGQTLSNDAGPVCMQ